MFSQPRFTDAAPSLGLKPGFAVDLATGWNLRSKSDKEAFFQELERDDPYLLTGSPPCDAFSVLRHIGKKTHTAEGESEKLSEGREHLQTAEPSDLRWLVGGYSFTSILSRRHLGRNQR